MASFIPFEGYASLRFLAGLGLAGELGAAITLISESFPKDSRDWAPHSSRAVGLPEPRSLRSSIKKFLGVMVIKWVDCSVFALLLRVSK